MSGFRIPIAGIRNNLLRRAAMCAVFPTLVAFHYALPVILLPLLCMWRIAQAAAEEFSDIVTDLRRTWLVDSRLLRAAWRLMWTAPVVDPEPAALEVKP